MNKAKSLYILARCGLVITLLLAWIAPAHANDICTANDEGYACNINIETYGEGPRITFSINTDQTTVTFITYTSLTCDDHGTDSDYADPYLKLYDATGQIIAEDDDSAPHNNGRTSIRRSNTRFSR